MMWGLYHKYLACPSWGQYSKHQRTKAYTARKSKQHSLILTTHITQIAQKGPCCTQTPGIGYTERIHHSEENFLCPSHCKITQAIFCIDCYASPLLWIDKKYKDTWDKKSLFPVYWNKAMLVYNIPSTPVLDMLFLYWYKEYADIQPTSNFFLSAQFISIYPVHFLTLLCELLCYFKRSFSGQFRAGEWALLKPDQKAGLLRCGRLTSNLGDAPGKMHIAHNS